MKKVIELLILSDLALVIGSGLVEPIFAVFVNLSIEGGTVFAIGLASSIYLLSGSALHIPIGRIADKHRIHKELLVLGTALMTLCAFAYSIATNMMQIYLIQFLYGIAFAMAFSTWCATFSHFLDKDKEAFEWSIYKTITGVGAAAAAVMGGFAVELIGFRSLFVINGVLGIIGTLVLLVIINPNINRHKKHHLIHHRAYQHKIKGK
ncbi:MAG: MFS transporter [Candidatus Diapherotrites archaeon]|nr:MFS transporter [Candidatus Diapherotrites archaeon]